MNTTLVSRVKIGVLLTIALYLGAFGVFYSVLAVSAPSAPNMATAIMRPTISVALAAALLFLSWRSFIWAKKRR